LKPQVLAGSIAGLALGFAAACGETNTGDAEVTRSSSGVTATSGGGSPEAASCPGGSEPRSFFRDDDGDGFGQKLPAGTTCSDDPPSGHAFLGGTTEDCDDTDPELYSWANFYTDADGDGYGVPYQEHAFDCSKRVIAGMASNARDCDDADTSSHLQQFVDADGDGHGVQASAACVADDAEGYALVSGDCDDSQADVHPYSEFEAPLDGIDSDCDGNDYPVTGCGVFVAPEGDVPVDTACAGSVDLFLASVSACLDCSGSRVELVVGNRGSVSTEAELLISGDAGTSAAEPVRLALDGPLAPGALSQRLLSAAPLPTIHLEIAGTEGLTDCNPEDNVGQIQVGFVECF